MRRKRNNQTLNSGCLPKKLFLLAGMLLLGCVNCATRHQAEKQRDGNLIENTAAYIGSGRFISIKSLKSPEESADHRHADTPSVGDYNQILIEAIWDATLQLLQPVRIIEPTFCQSFQLAIQFHCF